MRWLVTAGMAMVQKIRLAVVIGVLANVIVNLHAVMKKMAIVVINAT